MPAVTGSVHVHPALPSRAARLQLAAERRAANAGYRAPAGKPDKRARRLIQALGDLDAL